MFPLILRSWSWQPGVLLALGLMVAVYAYAFYHMHHQGRLKRMVQQREIKRSQPWCFGAGLVTLFIALVSPIDTLSGTLFLMHMTQHVLLIMVAAPLILLGLPAPFLLPLIQTGKVKAGLAWLTHPVIAFALYNAILLIWHLPDLYEAALRHDIVHSLEHALFFGSALLSWWPLLSPLPELPRLSYPAQILYIFLMAIPAGILGAVLVFSGQAFYPTYIAAPRLGDFSAVADQQAGGLVMMVPGKFIYLIALTIIFFIWFNQDEPVGQEQLI